MRIFVVLLCLSLVACGRPTANEDAAAVDATAQVRIAPATLGSSSDAVTIYGAAEADSGRVHALVAQSEAVVQAIVAPSGTAVRAGQVVATLRASPTARLDTVRAASDARAANLALARAIRLRGDGLGSDAEVDAARGAANAASATVASFGARNDSLTLRAPVAGTVSGVVVHTGDLIASGTAIATIAENGNLRVRLGVDPLLAQRIYSGQSISLLPVGGGSAIPSTVLGVDTATDATTRLAAVFASLPPGYAAGAGEAFRATLTVGATSNSLTIPYAALLDDGGKSYVFVVEKGVAHRRDVIAGSATGDRIAITSGLSAGAQVVTEGGTALDDGMKVKVAASAR